MEMKKMRTQWKKVALAAMLFSFAFTGQASAAGLGDTLANQLCSTGGLTYTLSIGELPQWTGQTLLGTYSKTVSGVTYTYTFKKTASHDEKANCIKSSPRSTGGNSCTKWGVTKSGNVLTEGTAATNQCN